FKNFLLLPGNESPERILAEMLFAEKESSEIWNKLYSGYDKQLCFHEYGIDDIRTDRTKAKNWFNSQKVYWGSGNSCSKIINLWIEKNKVIYNQFLTNFDKFVETFKK